MKNIENTLSEAIANCLKSCSSGLKEADLVAVGFYYPKNSRAASNREIRRCLTSMMARGEIAVVSTTGEPPTLNPLSIKNWEDVDWVITQRGKMVYGFIQPKASGKPRVGRPRKNNKVAV